MILRRKESKPIGVGDVCNVSSSMRKKLINNNKKYLETSAPHSYDKNFPDNFAYAVGSYDISKSSKKLDKAIHFADAEVCLIHSKSFLKDYYNVIPLRFKRDSHHYATMTVATHKVKSIYVVHKSLLDRYSGNFYSNNCSKYRVEENSKRDCYSDHGVNCVKNSLKNNYDIGAPWANN